MRAVVASAVLALAASASPAPAQGVQESLELSREVIDQQKRTVVAGSLPLSEAQTDRFWSLYDDFQKELKKLDVRTDRLIASYTAEVAALSDTRARALLDESLQIAEERAKLMRKWSKRFGDVLPPRLLVRYFQLEHRFHTFVAADLARQIPLAP